MDYVTIRLVFSLNHCLLNLTFLAFAAQLKCNERLLRLQK